MTFISQLWYLPHIRVAVTRTISFDHRSEQIATIDLDDATARLGAARRGVITPGLAGGYMASYFHQVASQLPALVQNASPQRRRGRSRSAFYAVQWYFSRHTLLILLANSIEISCTVNDFSYRLAFPRGHAKRMKQKSKNGEKEENHSISLVIFLGGSLPAPV